ncbi:helix-turn-helix domain-containing protein [Bifidobacterium amazonense]|uniref:Helix-turn-helix domain-containing protein n=1 Tax=Bifidobacterium amazonense TaxID=2809027 RepID=A0ABS9VWB4_9BIFI|nr:helix-turn-helix transcriptional regulator [Bifidobacterium amazonense]MCH9276408.1 helix-turn-helix domain-containing protein [Bifidobacterium amazonense]
MAGTDKDIQVGRNLASLRGSLSQEELAARMKQRGYRWSQSTVWSIERGDRPLRLTEALDVLDCLGCEGGEIWQLVAANDEVRSLQKSVDSLEDGLNSLEKAWEKIEHDRRWLLISASVLSADDLASVEESVHEILLRTRPERILKDVIRHMIIGYEQNDVAEPEADQLTPAGYERYVYNREGFGSGEFDSEEGKMLAPLLRAWLPSVFGDVDGDDSEV